MLLASHDLCTRQRGRVVKAEDSNLETSFGLCPRRFESCRCRFFAYAFDEKSAHKSAVRLPSAGQQQDGAPAE